MIDAETSYIYLWVNSHNADSGDDNYRVGQGYAMHWDMLRVR